MERKLNDRRQTFRTRHSFRYQQKHFDDLLYWLNGYEVYTSCRSFVNASTVKGIWRQSWPSDPLLQRTSSWSLNSVKCALRVSSLLTRNWSRHEVYNWWSDNPAHHTQSFRHSSPRVWYGTTERAPGLNWAQRRDPRKNETCSQITINKFDTSNTHNENKRTIQFRNFTAKPT